MRHQGKLVSWKAEQGFGFVVQNGSDRKAFVHASAFADRTRRPAVGDLITYEVEPDGRRGPRAAKVKFVRPGRAPAPRGDAEAFGNLVAVGFGLALAASVIGGRLPLLVPVWLAAMSAATFVAYWVDKQAARSGTWRTPESTLHLLALAGGWPGALLARRILRHKSVKASFRTMFRLTVALNSLALGWLLTQDGSALVHLLAGLLRPA
ncbi:Uncharacterized membrane protein YsdA, DUF1294 family [Noviherbaspirillum humi]|uniref:Uncharacterized membrane protein YsdA, DUF1294 family n=1 Tax=Noviherbaspirillum humi TaxID=1688639 RepID=A0A239LX70_9BURK|nr:cold shock and DUF1294 domain-containing protein [Noviherbaspirillum humi]SNT34880.1 Uncharacterized membrane protein YsdA, DUF1294 family [Noviherbaspirillum humi]